MIEMRHITKEYRVARRDAGMGQAVRLLFARRHDVVRALDDVSFTIADGEMVGYMGPNGAGKSSTIKILSGILTPERGELHRRRADAVEKSRGARAAHRRRVRPALAAVVGHPRHRVV